MDTGAHETFSGANEDDFFVTRSDCGGQLAPGASCQMRVKFSPSGAGARSSTFTLPATLTSNHDDASISVALSGTGSDVPTGPQGPVGQDCQNRANGHDGATGAQGPAGQNGKNERTARRARRVPADRVAALGSPSLARSPSAR